MTTTAQILRKAAADVRLRGVLRSPDVYGGETCAVVSVDRIVPTIRSYYHAVAVLRLSLGLPDTTPVSRWNDSQVSRAVVASEMESAADLAELMEGRGGLA